MAKSDERTRTMRQRRRFPNRSTQDFLRHNGDPAWRGYEEEQPHTVQCHWCERWYPSKDAKGVPKRSRITADHVIPRAWMPDSVVVVPACRACNQRKGANVWECSCETCTMAMFLYKAWAAGHLEDWVDNEAVA